MNLPDIRGFFSKPGKKWGIFGIAVAMGIAAALGARSYLNGRVAEIAARAKVATVDVLVAKSALGVGTILSRANVAVRQVPSEFSHSVAVSPADFDRIDGRVVAYAIRGGEMILWGLLENQRVPTFSAHVVNGRRAITVPVDEINSISGLLEPDDQIDLIVSIERDGRRVVRPLLQRVRVMATGQRSIDNPKTGERREYSTVTLDTTPEQARRIIAAREGGQLTALLRNPQDAATAGFGDGARIGAGYVVDRPRRPIPVIYGSAAGTLPPHAISLTPGMAGAVATVMQGADPPQTQ